LIFLLVVGAIKMKFSFEFFQRIALVSIMQLCLFFHRFYFKSYAIFTILQNLENYYGVDLALNIFTIFLMVYYSIYEFLSKQFLLYFFKKIIIVNELSYNILIFALKLVSVDVLSINALNALTIPLTEPLSWICFVLYIYLIFSTYSRTNILISFPMKVYRRIFKKKASEKKGLKELEKFEDLRSGCIFETNLIVFLRIISYRIFNYFLFFTKEDYLYQDCTLKEKIGDAFMYDTNIIMIMVTHTVLLGLLGVIVYGFKFKKYLFNYHIEEINICGRFLLFLACFSYADYSLQIYKAFNLKSS